MYALFAHGLEAITPPVPLFESIVNKLPDSRQESARTAAEHGPLHSPVLVVPSLLHFTRRPR
jgi:hypothetical protein